MTHSTTGTFTYAISKYSRSYPNTRAAQRTSITTSGPELPSEWQHFTNPIIRLILDIKTKTTTNELESVRMRVLWKMDNTEGSKETEVTFEDLDLLALSFLPSLGPNKNHPEGLPLKAVYRDTVVGIRYLYSQEDPLSPIFRRFQLSFQSSVEASAFIDSVRPICPCKLNAIAPQSNSGLKSMMAMNPPATRRAPTLMPPVARGDSAAIRKMATINSSGLWAGPNLGTLQQPAGSSLSLCSSPLRQQSIPSPVPLNFSSGNAENVSPPVNYPPLAQDTNPVYPTSAIQTPNVNPTNPVGLPPSSLPTASTPDPNSRQSTFPTVHASAKGSISATLSGHPSVYDLPPPDLEDTVAQIIREDGFLELMEKLSDIIRIKEGVSRARTIT